TIDNGVANPRIAANANVRKQDALVNFTITVDPDVGREYGIHHSAAANNASTRNDGIHGNAHPLAFLSENKLGRGILALVGSNGPTFVIQVEVRRDSNQVNVGIVISSNGSHI